MLTVYGADWCEDTQRSRRHLRRLAIRHAYVEVDADPAALERAKALNGGERRTPIIELDGEVLVEPSNAVLTNALLRHAELTDDEARERLALQNVGDLERVLRVTGGLLTVVLSRQLPRPARWLLGGIGVVQVLSGATGWCPVFAAARISSLEGPGDRPREAQRPDWLTSSSA